MGVGISISITQNSQNIANNTSNVTVNVIAEWWGGSYNHNMKSGSLTIDGTKYSFTANFNTSQITWGQKTLFTKTVDVKHADDGTKTLACSAVYISGVSSGTVTASASQALTKITRLSTLTASNGELGKAQALTINRNNSTFTHSIRYDCGAASGTVCTKVSDTSVSFTPSLNLAQQNKTGTSVSVKLTLYTFDSNGTELGTTTKTITCTIPASVKPTVSLAVSDATGHKSKYDAYVQGQSKLAIVATGSGIQGSTIKAYKTTADGKTYTEASVTTDAIKGSGDLAIKSTVTDSRSRTGTDSETISVLAYSAPKITALKLARCNADGTSNASGSYISVTFSASITALNNKNSAAYTVQYKKVSDTAYTSATLSSYAGKYTVTNGVFIFAADSATYDVILTATDDFTSVKLSQSGGTVKKLFSILKKSFGIAFGKVATRSEAVEFGLSMYDKFDTLIGNGLAAYTSGGDAGIDPNTTLEGLCLTSHSNAPQGLGTFYYIHTTFYNTKSATAARAQVAVPYKKNGSMYHRYFESGAWSSWARYMTADEIYPVGSVCIRYDTTSPATLYGGTWTRLEGRFLYGCATSGTVGATGSHTTGSGSSTLPYVNVAVWRRTA